MFPEEASTSKPVIPAAGSNDNEHLPQEGVPPTRRSGLANLLGIIEQNNLTDLREQPLQALADRALDELAGAGFTDLVHDWRDGCTFCRIVIHDYASFEDLNATAGIATGWVRTRLNALKAKGYLTATSARFRFFDFTQRGRFAAYIVRTSLEASGIPER